MLFSENHCVDVYSSGDCDWKWLWRRCKGDLGGWLVDLDSVAMVVKHLKKEAQVEHFELTFLYNFWEMLN